MAQSKQPVVLHAQALVQGVAEGPLMMTTTPLSFWGGINPSTGEVIDRNHPFSGMNVAGKVLAIPSGRGSCTGSCAILQLIWTGLSPSALVFEHEEDIITLGVIVAEEFFSKSIPVIRLPSAEFNSLRTAAYAKINGDKAIVYAHAPTDAAATATIPSFNKHKTEIQLPPGFELTEYDSRVLRGDIGKAAQAAAQVILRMAIIQGATGLLDVTQVHIDGCIYTGPATLAFAKKLRDMGGKVRVPTTMNSISIDRQRWRTQGVDAAAASAAGDLADVYQELGAQPTYTCAPYLLDSAPTIGEQIGWAESNAVVFANSVLGARTMKYPDCLDVCIALTGRALKAGCHVVENRRAQIKISVPPLASVDDSFFPLLGYLVGDIARSRIPIVTGLEEITITHHDLKAFGAAFATTSSAPMFHIAGVTPEAKATEDQAQHLSTEIAAAITSTTMAAAWRRLDKAQETKVDLVSLGAPHFSYEELVESVAQLKGRTKSETTGLIITCGRTTWKRAQEAGILDELTAFGAKIITDTCWCMIEEPIIPKLSQTIMTNSAKYAHYGEGLTGRKMRFGSLSECLEAACTGVAVKKLPPWLQKY